MNRMVCEKLYKYPESAETSADFFRHIFFISNGFHLLMQLIKIIS